LCSRPLTRLGPVGCAGRLASVREEFRHRRRSHKSGRAVLSLGGNQKRELLYHPETSEVIRRAWVERSIAPARYHPPCSSKGCPRDRTRRRPIVHPSRRLKIRQICHKERA